LRFDPDAKSFKNRPQITLCLIEIQPNLARLYLAVQFGDSVFQRPRAVFDRGMIGISDKHAFKVAKSTGAEG
jgi:hypothetical protein